MVHGVPTDSTPKTSAGQRTIGLDESTVALLAEHQQRQHARELACAAGFWRAEGHVFTDDVGRPLVPENVTKGFAAGSPARRACHRSAFTTRAIPTPPLCCGPGSTSKSWPAGWATPAPRSRRMSTSTGSSSSTVPQLRRWQACSSGPGRSGRRTSARSWRRVAGCQLRRPRTGSLPWSPGSRGRRSTDLASGRSRPGVPSDGPP